MTSRVRCAQPPVRAVWHRGKTPGRGSPAWRVPYAAGQSRADASFAAYSPLQTASCAWRQAYAPASWPPARRGQTGFQALDPLAQFDNHVLLPGDHALLFRC